MRLLDLEALGETKEDYLMKYLFVALLASLLASPGPAFSRPQLANQSIGWIDPSDIACPSDHTCSVHDNRKSGPFAFTHPGPSGNQSKYRVPAGTELVILDQGKDNEPELDTQTNEWKFAHRINVEIVRVSD